MESTGNRFPFNSLPMEMKEKILEKVNPEDSMKLLEANKQLQAYILDRGPFYKRFEEIKYGFMRSGLAITYVGGGECSNICLLIEHDGIVLCPDLKQSEYPFCLSEKNYLRLRRLTRAHLQFLGRTMPPRMIQFGEFFVSTLGYLQPPIILRDIIPNCRFVHGLSLFSRRHYDQLEDLIKLFSLKITDSFVADYSDVKVARSNQADYLLRLKSMLVDCKEVNICLIDGGELLLEALRASNIEKISMYFPMGGISLFLKHFQMIATDGVPSRNNQVEAIFRLCLEDPEDRAEFDFNASAFVERIRIEVPSVRPLSTNPEDEMRYRQLFEEISDSQDIGCDLNNLWIYETSSPRKCIFFVCFEVREICLIPHYA